MLPNNAIAWAHFQLRGGWKNALIVSSVYLAALLILIGFVSHNDPRGAGRLSAWTSVILGLQSAGLLLFAGSRISVAIRSDLNSRLIESHRLMPLQPWRAVLGYVVGPSGQAICFAIANLLLGAGLAFASGQTIEQWLLANFILLMFAIFVWSLAAAGAFCASRGKGGIGWIAGLFFFGFTSQGMVLYFLPAVSLLASPISGKSIFVGSTGGVQLSLAYAFSLPAQIVLGTLFFLAAARKYRQSEVAAFTPTMSLILLATWTLLSAAGILCWDEVGPGKWLFGGMGHDYDMRAAQLIASILASMLLAILPVASSCRFEADWKLRRAIDDPALPRRPAPPWLVGLGAIVLCLPVVLVAPPKSASNSRDYALIGKLGLTDQQAAMLLSALTIAAFMGSITFLLRIARRGGGRSIVIPTVFLVLAWLIPLGIDVVRHIGVDSYDDPVIQFASTFSPIGVLVTLWAGGKTDPVFGVLAQCALAMLLAGMEWRTRSRQ